jgi:hypothetical protein
MSGFSNAAKRVLGDLMGGATPVIITNPISGSSWKTNQTLRNIRIPIDGNQNAWALPVFLINPGQNPVTTGGSIGTVNVADPSSGNEANIEAIPSASTDAGVTLSAYYALMTQGVNYYLNQALGTYTPQEQPSGVANVAAAAAASTSLLAAGGASKQYKVFGVSISVDVGSTSSNTTAKVTDGTIVYGSVSVGAAAHYLSNTFLFPNGILSTANAAISLTMSNTTNAIADATVIYGAAR